MIKEMEGVDTNKRLEKMFLVHSFIYYRMNQNIVSDSFYDSICIQLAEAIANGYTPEHYEVTQLDESGSGYYLMDYPSWVYDKAQYLLHLAKKRGV